MGIISLGKKKGQKSPAKIKGKNGVNVQPGPKEPNTLEKLFEQIRNVINETLELHLSRIGARIDELANSVKPDSFIVIGDRIIDSVRADLSREFETINQQVKKIGNIEKQIELIASEFDSSVSDIKSTLFGIESKLSSLDVGSFKDEIRDSVEKSMERFEEKFDEKMADLDSLEEVKTLPDELEKVVDEMKREITDYVKTVVEESLNEKLSEFDKKMAKLEKMQEKIDAIYKALYG